jgi:hypothetical protein
MRKKRFTMNSFFISALVFESADSNAVSAIAASVANLKKYSRLNIVFMSTFRIIYL